MTQTKKVLLFLLVAVVTFASCEIVPRFPGAQPILIPGSGHDTTGGDDGGEVVFEDKYSIDTFEQTTEPLVVISLTNPAPPNVTAAGFDVGNSIIGGERDIILTAETGNRNLIFSAGAGGGQFVLATPGSGSGFVVVQYDGRDGSQNLDTTTGLRGIDLTENNASGFRIGAFSDISTEFTVNLYDSNNNVASAFAQVEGSVGLLNYFIEFSLFEDTIDLTSINAITFLVEAFDNVDFVLTEFVAYGGLTRDLPANCFQGVVLPCDTDYYRVLKFDQVAVGDYLSIEYRAIGENDFPESGGRMYMIASPFEDLQVELASNENIVDTLGALPGPNNYDYTCDGNCDIEILWSSLKNETYYFAIEGTGPGNLVYEVCVDYLTVPVTQLLDQVPQPVFRDQRVTQPPTTHAPHYHYYVIDIPEVRYVEGGYLVVNISRAEPFPGLWMGLMYESLPIKGVDTGIIGEEPDLNSEGDVLDDLVYPFCVDMSHRDEDFPDYDHPVREDERERPCQCTTEVQIFGEGPAFQLTCELVVDPCAFEYGNWYIAVELPEREFPADPADISGRANYTIGAFFEFPTITELERNVTLKSFVFPEAMTHFKIEVPATTTVPGATHFLVQLSNVRNGFVDIWVHQGLNPLQNLAGGPEACVPANATCHTCDACNVVIEKCHFVPGTWYISVSIGRADDEFQIFDVDRLPITYTLRATWLEDSAPVRLTAGVPVATYIGEALYDFYVVEVPPTIDTWLFVELYAKAEDTEVIVALLHGALPGGDCYHRPDFYCMTGDPYDKRWSTGPPTFYDNEPVQRESCSFMIQTCELEAGPLFLSVYGHHRGYTAYGDTTFYQVPVHYTLWVDFDVALALTSGVSYSETVFEKQYQHYYIRADRVLQGSWLSVEITNIQHGIPQSIEAFINYNYLAGNCPCYDNLYNCTSHSSCRSNQLEDPTALPDVDSVLNCCTIVVPASDFRPGVWYIAVLGVNEDLFQYTTPIGYTLTATVHDAPVFNPLILGQIYNGEVPQWNITNEYANFRLGASPIPGNDLVLKVTFVQNCEFMGKHDDSQDSIWMYVNKGAPASHYQGGWQYKCQADVFTQSYCTIVIPDCEWEGDDYFVAIKGDYDADFTGRFTLRATSDEVRDYQLTDSVPHYARVSEGRYKHFFIDTTAEESEYLAIDIYTNQDQDAISAYMNKDARAGDAPCHTHVSSCETETMCSFQLLACEMEPGRYYFSVFGHPGQFYDTSVEFTITASHKQVANRLFNGDPFTGHIWMAGQVQHYYFEIDEAQKIGSYITFEVDNVKHGAVTAYVQYGFLAGRCPCFIYEYTCSAAKGVDGLKDWCEIRVPSCDLKVGKYFFSIWATENLTPQQSIFMTPIGYTLEVNVITPLIVRPNFVLNRIASNTEIFQFVGDERYIHYSFPWTAEDFDAGYHVIVEITSVRDGALFVYYTPGEPGDSSPSCHTAQICTNGLAAGGECLWQLPYCLTRPLNDTSLQHFISVEGKTGRVQASFNILLYKENVPTVLANPFFTLDNSTSSAEFPIGTELNITHSKVHEPNGWTQFIRLVDVPAHNTEGRGAMLELFFYRVTNNFGEPLDFNVYVHPKRPAGAHGCCGEDPVSLGACQEAPCSNTADTTVSVNAGDDVFTHTCDFDGAGVGNNANSIPFFGQRCTVRVWPCEFNKYCNEELLDWFVSVVPIEATSPTSNGAGLSYSLQWRVRDIQLTDAEAVGSLSLNEFVNTYEYTPTYDVPWFTTESEGWRSFYVDYTNATNTRLSIQTQFVSGSGVVYINGDEFASDTDSCHQYECGPTGACDSTGRFYVSECQSHYYSRYYITLRNTGDINTDLQVRFRIVSIVLPAALEMTSHASDEVPFNATSGPSIYPGVTGVEGDNYDSYYVIVDDDDLDNHNNWIVDVSRPTTGSDTGNLQVYIRFGNTSPGQYGVDNAQSYYDPLVEGCHAWQYTCDLPPQGRCVWQIPHCQTLEGYWQVAIGNPNFQFDGIPTDLPDYTIRTYISDPPIALSLGEQYVHNVTVNETIPLLQHFYINITADALEFDDRDSLTGFWTRYLRFQLDGIPSGESVNLYVNYDDLAGPEEEHSCLNNFASATCGTSSCRIDITPCQLGEGSLVSGIYYIAVEYSGAPTTFALLTRIYRNEYSPIILTETIEGTGHRAGTTNQLYRYTVTEDERLANGDGDGNYRYVINEPAVTDDLDDHEYLIFNFTALASADSTDSLSIEIWRDDCTRYQCALSGPNSWCTIDALGLSPATAKLGRFFIRVENPDALPFTIDYYHNQTTIQNILDRQTITEIIYPYEYQEYYYEAADVGQGATLTVNICSICGNVQAFIRPDLPAGPYDVDHPEINAAIDSCEAVGPNDNTFVEENNCCTLFLDTCEYQQRGYYIGIRGVTQTFPPENQHIYLPAKYQIEPFQTTVKITEIEFSQCVQTISYTAPWTTVPSQYAFDLETINVGTTVRVTIIVPTSIYTISTPASISITPNATVGYSSNCPLASSSFSCSTGDDNSCSILIPYDSLSLYDGARYYIWADAPRGTELLVERFDPYIPTILPNVAYTGTVGAESDLNTQFYRFELDPKQDENYWERFFLRVLISDVSQGSVRVILSTGAPVPDRSSDLAIYLAGSDDLSEDGFLDISYEDLIFNFDSAENIPKVFWLSVIGAEQLCELHSIKYTITVQTNWIVTYYPIGETICNTVNNGQNNFHRLQPQAVEDPQQSILRFSITDLSGDGIIALAIKDQFLATEDSANVWYARTSDAEPGLTVDWFCGYEQLYFSVIGSEVDEEVGYRMSVHKEKIHVKEVFDDSIYYADDDDDDACPHEHDFYIFRTAAPLGSHEGSFFRVLVDSLFKTKVYVNKNTVAWGPCHDSGYGENDPSETGTTSVNVYDFCDFEDGVYYITVVSDGPYYIYTDIRDDAKNLTLGEVFRDGLEPGEYQMYTLEICQDWFEADDRLVVEITDVQGGDVYGWIRRDANPGLSTTETLWPLGFSCSDDSAQALYGAGESGYDFLLVNHCELLPGTYHILIRTQPNELTPGEGSPSRNIEKLITYRLFPYLIDYNIDTVELLPNTIISDVVDVYTINRFDPSSVKYANYYHLMPLMEGDGYFEQISHAVAKLSNVQGGLLNMKVMCGHLAISEQAYIDGEVYGLTKDSLIDPSWRMQSSRYPFTLQTVFDERQSVYQPECDGCSDFCISMNLDDLDIYTRDSSAALWIPSCYFIWATFYIAVEPINQYYIDHSITYDLEVHHTRDYILLQPNTNQVDSFSLGNWDYDFYYSISPEPQSMRWRVVVTSGEGVLVTVRNHRCPLQATWVKEVWCDAAYFDRPWMCDIEIPTRAAHPGDNAFFVAVYGKNATYSIAFWRGRENCHAFTGSGRDDGLNFCAGLVPYATWRWENYDNLDKEAHCLFEDLYNHFKCQPCWNGVSRECNATLQAFACYESFRKCDQHGFAVGTCKDSCEAVVYECANHFDTVDLEHYNCSSARYIDSAASECAGNENFSSFNSENQLFLEDDPQLILFKSSPPAASSSSSASSLTVSAVLSVIALILVLVV